MLNVGMVGSESCRSPPPSQKAGHIQSGTKNWAGSSDIFYFCPSSKGRGAKRGGVVQRGGGISLKSEEKGGKRGGGRLQEKGRRHIYFEG